MASVNKVNRGKWLRKLDPESYKELLRKQLESRILKNDSGCWLWTGSKQKNGYGSKKLYGKQTPAHRASYFAYKGEIHPELEVMHTCDVRICINPDHLVLGSHQENMRDAKLRCINRNGVMTGSYTPIRDVTGRFVKLRTGNGQFKSV